MHGPTNIKLYRVVFFFHISHRPHRST